MANTKILAACTGGGAGDLLATLPAVNALHRHFGMPIDVLTTAYASPVIEGQPPVGEILLDDGREPLRSLATRLENRNYSHAVVFWSNPRIARAVQQAGIPARVGQARRLYSFRYTKRVGVRSELGDRTSHWTDIQMDYARALGARSEPEDYRIIFSPNSQDEREAAEVIERTAGDEPFIIFHAARGITAGAAHWPSSHFARIGDALATRFRAPVLLTGSSNEAPLVALIAASMQQPAFNIAGHTTLRGFATLARRAVAVVALDSGPMHLAAVAGAPTVGIFALRTDLPERWRPLGPRVAVVDSEYPCPPLCRKETCRTFACYAALSPERVVEAAQSISSLEPSATVG